MASPLGWAWLIPAIVLMVLAHEAGHYWAARRLGVRVLQVGLGLGPKVVGRRIRGTLYTLNLLPVGAFVQLQDEGDAGFRSLGLGRRAAVLLAGASVNILMGLVILVGVSAWPKTDWVGDVTVQNVVRESPAATAGILPGDVIRAVDGVAVETVLQLRDRVAAGGEVAWYSVEREGRPVELSVESSEERRLGVRVSVMGRRSASREWTAPHAALVKGLALSWVTVWEPVVALMPGGEGLRIAGPVGLAEVMNVAVESRGFGVAPLMAGALSIHLGLLNLAPFPGLDGGHLVLLGLERVRGRPLPRRVEDGIGMLGLGVLMAFISIVCWIEVLRWGG